MKYFKHERAMVDSDTIGEGTNIWANAHVLKGAVIGKNCNISEGVFIESDVKIGDNVTLKCGVYIWDSIRLGDNVFIGPNATFTNDLFPRSKKYPKKFLQTVIENGASIGANATILAGLRIGENAMIGAGSVITKDSQNNSLAIARSKQVNIKNWKKNKS